MRNHKKAAATLVFRHTRGLTFILKGKRYVYVHAIPVINIRRHRCRRRLHNRISFLRTGVRARFESSNVTEKIVAEFHGVLLLVVLPQHLAITAVLAYP